MKQAAGRARRGGGVRLTPLAVGVVGAGVLAAVLWSVASAARAAALARRRGARFSAFIDDLPIMPGLFEVDEGYAFGLYPRGRLAEARLAGAADAAVVRGFYAATLTQLGWRPSEAEPYVYHRGDERLIFLVEPPSARSRKQPRQGWQAVFVITPATAVPAAR